MAGSYSEHTDRLPRGFTKPDDSLPVFRDTSHLSPELVNRNDIYDHFAGEKLSSAETLQLDRCPFCGHPELKEVPENGHYRTTCCKQITTGCCNGECSLASGDGG